MFKPVKTDINFPELERDILKWWYESGVVQKYLHKNDNATQRFNFLDGPITANNPMGVHHAWGRMYKDLWQRFYTMRGYKQRYRNGFDCQGLWVEVEVEKDLGFKSKKDIENYGVANFVNKCKERVLKYSAIQTEQTKRLGNFMDWDNSYFTMSDENNYAIWNFIKVCSERGWLYKGHESIPWCPRCETAISQHEMLTEDYKELVHESVYLKLPMVDRKNESLLVWTTTPWTIPANIAVAVDAKMDYALVDNIWVGRDAVERVFGAGAKATRECKGKDLVGEKYAGPFDDLPAVKKVRNDPKFHIVVATDDRILPISKDEGTGLVHTAVSAGVEDFQLGKKLGLPMIPVIADNADYLEGFGDFSGKNAKKHPELILDYLKMGDWVLKTVLYTHRYPACWRCKTELVWKVADEWYISMDKADPTDAKKRTLRQEMVDTAKMITWLPSFGLDRELDWLKNMHDWLISKKNRYWGLALPIYDCPKCGEVQVIGSKDELQKKAVAGWDKFDGNSPHKPWIDEVKIACTKCGEQVSRIGDVGNPWLDAGIVPFSTMPEDWFPADFITESFPGQFKNWFYAMIAMSTVLKKTNPYKTVLGFASLLAEDGRPMHKSWGNAIEFNEGADKIGADVMRWRYALQRPTDNLLFGYKTTDEVRRRHHLILWNVYNYFVTYANLANFAPAKKLPADLTVLDEWILVRLAEVVNVVTDKLTEFDPQPAALAIEELVQDLSTWFVRRSRSRTDQVVCFEVLWHMLVNISLLMAPFNPFISEEIYKNLTGEESVHLASWPKFAKTGAKDKQLLTDMALVRRVVEMGLSERKNAAIKVRQPLRSVIVSAPDTKLNDDLLQLIQDELNVKAVEWQDGEELKTVLNTKLDPELIEEGKVRELVRAIQDMRKEKGARLDQHIKVTTDFLPTDPQLLAFLKSKALIVEVELGNELQIELL